MSIALSSLTLLCVLCISAGQLMFKQAANSLPAQAQLTDWLCNGWLLASLGLYAMTTLGWIWILRHAPLHIAYPFMGLAFIIVPLLAWWLLGEPLTWQSLVGGSLILAGVALASSGGSA